MRRAASEQGVGSTISDLSHTDNPFPLTSTISTEVLIEEFSRGMCSSTTPGRHTSPPIAGGPFLPRVTLAQPSLNGPEHALGLRFAIDVASTTGI